MRSTTSKSHLRLNTHTRLLAAAILGWYSALPAWAQQPTGMSVQYGTATQSTSGNVLTITNSNGAVIHWDSFSIAKGYTTYFQQGSASSSVLNRVVGASPSQIYGTLSSNGKVWLINPNGVLVGAGGVVDTAGFIGSTLDVSNANFLAGRLSFIKTPGAKDFVNQGTIKTPSGGSVYLVGTNVSNEGLITTPQGETILAAGETVDLLDTGTPGVKVEITGAAGNTTNLGEIVAEAGRIGMAGVMVKNSGTLNASSVVNEGGRVFLKATQDTYVDGNGRIVATGTKGGRVEVLGNRVAVMDNAEIDVSGANGGGTILLGGDYQGKNPNIQNANITYFGPNAKLKADATDKGDGGKVIVWADDTTRAYGSISARGGANGGNGGFVETSGHRYLDADHIKLVDTRAPMGKRGSWLLDPTDITIVHGDGSADTASSSGNAYIFSYDPADTATLSDSTLNSLLSYTDVTVSTSGLGAGTGNITVMSGVSLYTSYPSWTWPPKVLTLQAANDIVFKAGAAPIRINDSAAAPLELRLDAGHAVSTEAGATVNVGGGTGTAFIKLLNGGWTNSGTVSLNHMNASIDLGGRTFTNEGTLRFQSGGSVSNGTLQNKGMVDVQQSSTVLARFDQASAGVTNLNGNSLGLYLAGAIEGQINMGSGGRITISGNSGSAADLRNLTITGLNSTLTIGAYSTPPVVNIGNVTAPNTTLRYGWSPDGDYTSTVRIVGTSTFADAIDSTGRSSFGLTNAILHITAPSFTVPNGATYSGDVGYATDGDLVVNGATENSTGSMSLVAANALKVGGTVAGKGVLLAGRTIDVTAGVHDSAATAADGGITFIAGDFSASGASAYLRSDKGSVVGIVANNIALSGGAYMEAGKDITLGFAGRNSMLSLSSGGYLLADSPHTINLAFPGRSRGGVMIDGIETTSSTPNDSGLFVLNHATPAIAGAGLNIIYSSTNTTPATIGATIDAINSASRSPVINIAPTPPVAGASSDSGGNSIGGGDDEFGGKNTNNKDKEGSGNSGNGKDDKPSGKKSVGRCNA